MALSQSMTREQFQQIYQQGPEACFQLFQALAQRVAALEDKLAPGPHTPSSAQGFIKPKNQRPKTDRPTGGQKGHKGHTLEKNETPDETKKHQPNQLSNRTKNWLFRKFGEGTPTGCFSANGLRCASVNKAWHMPSSQTRNALNSTSSLSWERSST